MNNTISNTALLGDASRQAMRLFPEPRGTWLPSLFGFDFRDNPGAPLGPVWDFDWGIYEAMNDVLSMSRRQRQ